MKGGFNLNQRFSVGTKWGKGIKSEGIYRRKEEDAFILVNQELGSNFKRYSPAYIYIYIYISI